MHKINKNFIPDRDRSRTSFASKKQNRIEGQFKTKAEYNKFRFCLESSLIAEALSYSGAFSEIGKYLSPVNFTQGEPVELGKVKSPLHRFLWETMIKMYPTHPINSFTVSHFCYKNFSINLTKQISGITNDLPSKLNRPYYALLILEQDIRNHLLKLVYTFLSTAGDDFKKLEIMEIEEFLSDLSNDILKSIDGILDFFKASGGYSEEYAQVEALKKDVEKRVLQIKEMAQIKSLITHLDNFCNFSTANKEIIESVVDILKFCLVTNNPPYFLSESLTDLKTRLCYEL